MMKKYSLKTIASSFLADTITPVSAYLQLRDQFSNVLLLESSDYHGEEDSYSYICCHPIATFETCKGITSCTYPDGSKEEINTDPLEALKTFKSVFEYKKTKVKYSETGLFGYINYDAVVHFEEVEIQENLSTHKRIPEIRYALYKYLIIFDQFKNQCHVAESYLDEPGNEIKRIIECLHKQTTPSFSFDRVGEITSDHTDNEFLEMVKKGIDHCNLGDVFQVVFSRQFESAFKGDEFQVYRALRSINPSPYLFYFDYGSYKIFGSSPEAQIIVNAKEAVIYPIAGTFRRTGDDVADADLARKLLEDPKENSEHIMLVDLARNDLSKFTSDVTVETYKEVQYYSHVIHLVSKVTGQLDLASDSLDIVASTFPAGTLSGAPKHRAMELIGQYEKSARGYYGGAIGFMDFEGGFNHAIMIRTFLSQGGKLIFRAGAGIVSKSVPENEVQEVYNKLAALEKAMVMAQLNSKPR